MRKIETLAELRDARGNLAGTFGLIAATAGLHRGHLALVARARADCAHVGVCLFTDPAALGLPVEAGPMPPGLEEDLVLLEAGGVDLVWPAGRDALFPPGFQTWVAVERSSAPLEGKRRPDHFRTLTTVMTKLFNAFAPSHVYFGQKDAQQAFIIRCLVADLVMPVQVVVCQTVREADGLALSRQNARLNPDERRAASVLFRALEAARAAFEGGERDADMLRASMSSTVAAEPLAREEYVSVAGSDSLDELNQVEGAALMSVAARIGKTRLTDNLIVGQDG